MLDVIKVLIIIDSYNDDSNIIDLELVANNSMVDSERFIEEVFTKG